MLIELNPVAGRYTIALNNATGAAELMSDFSYLEDTKGGTLTFDFTHMAAPLTLEKRDEYTPRDFGYQPLQYLLEFVCAIGAYTERDAILPHTLEAILPTMKSKVGRFLHDMKLPAMLCNMGINVRYLQPVTYEIGSDDPSRQNLIPLTSISVTPAGPDFKIVGKIRRRMETTFSKGLAGDADLANTFTSIVSEAVDNMIDYGNGGTVAGLYYPRSGEVEISLVNRHGKFGGTTPEEERDALIAATEGKTQRSRGGGNGIATLSTMALACFGTLCFRNGNATLSMLPDTTMRATTEETGLPTLGASVTMILQMLPTDIPQTDNETLEEFKATVASSIHTFKRWRERQ